MSAVALVILIFFFLAAALGAVAFYTYQRKLRRAKAIERGLKMVPILIHLPPPSADTQGGNRDSREVMREKTAQAEVLYNMIAGTATEGFMSGFYGQRHVALELIAVDGVVHFFTAVPVALVSVVKKAVLTAYPGARLQEVEDHNIFNQEGRLAATLGGEMVLRQEYAYPIATYAKLERDPMEALLTTLSALDKKDGVAVQIMLRPAARTWTSRSKKLADGKRKGRAQDLGFSAMDLAKAAVKSPDAWREQERARLGGGPDISNLQLSEIESIEEKTKHPGFEVLVRVIVSTGSVARSQQLLRDIATTFALFEAPGMNGFKFLPALDVQGLVTAFIFRFFPPELKSNVLNSVELATLFHFPDSQFTPTRNVERQQSKQVDGPVQLPSVGLLFGHNEFRGVKKEIRLSGEDRRRHTYILGQTGTGKSTMLENLAVQDMLNGNGFAFIDPHGDSAEKLLALVPKDRAEDVIYFNPADTEYPLGLNLFEFNEPSQKDFLVQETINMLYKLYDPGKTGIIGPRYEHWYRNAALTLMSDPNGSTFIEIPKVFTDTDYLKSKFKYLKDPTVVDFWTKEMGQTSDYHKSEMLGWFVSKFGAFQNNEMMRNIIGQTKSAFNLRDVMDQNKILIVNLSKGRVGELNSQLLGMIFVIKFQAAAMSRADMPEDQRSDFCLYVDEFQNFSTDSFASILSEARKYRLNLIVANQFIGQLSDEIREAVFGNIGTIVAHRMGPEDAEYMVKQFAPVFDASDLVNMPNFNSAVRLMIGGLPSQPFTMKDSAPLGTPNLELGLAVKQLSAAKFGQAKAVVEADIAQRLSAKIAPEPVLGMPPVAEPSAGLTSSAAPAVAPVAAAPAPAPVAAAPAPHPALLAGGHGAGPVLAPTVVSPATGGTATGPQADATVKDAMTASVAVRTGAVPVVMPASAAVPVAQSQPSEDGGVPQAPSPGAVFTPVAASGVGSAAPVPPTVDPAADAADMAEEGGFGDLNAPLGAPQNSGIGVVPGAAQPGAVAPGPGLAMTPPPIGAPPVDLPVSGSQPVANGASAGVGVAPPVPPIGAPPVPSSSLAAVPAAPVTSVAPSAALPVAPVAEPNVLPTVPPIGAPPVDLSSVAPLPDAAMGSASLLPGVAPAVPPAEIKAEPALVAPKVVSDNSTLTLSDITGGKPLPTPSELDNIPVMTPGTEPAMTPPAPPISAAVMPVPQAAPVQAAVVQERPQLGTGAPLEGDPYANIDILGDLTPPEVPAGPVVANPATLAAGVPVPAAAAPVAVAVGTGKALPGDPHADVTLIGQNRGEPAPAPAAAVAPVAAPVPTVPPAPAVLAPPIPEPLPAPVAASVVEAAEPVPVSEMPAQVEAVPVSEAPKVVPAPPVPPLPVQPVAAPAIQAPLPATAPAAPPVPSVQPAPSQLSVAPAAPVMAPVAPKEVVEPPAPVPAATAPMPPAPPIEPLPSMEVSAAAPMPVAPVSEPVVAAEPAVAQSAQQPATVSPADQPLIHFVDPSAEAVLKRSDIPDAVTVDDASLLSGLPEGVEFVKPPGGPAGAQTPAMAVTPAVSVPAPMPTPPAPPMPTPLELAPEPSLPEPSADIVEKAPVAPVASPVSAASLQKMATTPPPIGAAPVDLDKIPLPPAPSEQVPTVSAAQTAAPEASKKPAVPELNASLAEALTKAPSAPAQPELQSAAVESVAAEPAIQRPKVEPAPEVKQAASEQPATPQASQPASVAPKAEPAAAQAEPAQSKPPVSETAQIEKAEHVIDDLLSVSLIHPDSSTSHRRLPEPVAPPPRDESGVDLEMNAARPVQPAEAPVGTPAHMAQHHGLKVIQPLEPIVPPKEQIAKELAAMQQAEAAGQQQAQDAQKAKPASVAARLAQALHPAAKAVPAPAQPASAPAPASASAPAQAPVEGIVKHDGDRLPEAAAPVLEGVQPAEEIEGLPQAESLAADDVAKARAEREAAAKAAQPAPEVVSTPAPPAARHEEKDEKAEGNSEQKPASEHKQSEVKKSQEKKPAGDQQSKPKPKPKEKPLEHIESEEEAEHNKPTEAEKEQGALTGKLIMPTGEKPKSEPVQPKAPKPKKLAPGEVFVDEKGNVIIGE